MLAVFRRYLPTRARRMLPDLRTSPARLIFRILLTPALGVLTTIAIAWGFALWPLPTSSSTLYSSMTGLPGPKPIMVPEYRGGPAPFDVVQWQATGLERREYRGSGMVFGNFEPSRMPGILSDRARSGLWTAQSMGLFPPLWGQAPDTKPDASGAPWVESVQDARGWPFLALACEWPVYASAPAVFTFYSALKPNNAIALPDAIASPFGGVAEPLRALPCRPIWRGLLADITIYSAAWGALLFIPGRIRRHLRLRRSLCPTCAYDLSATGGPPSGCPECGWNRPASSPPPAHLPTR